MNKNIEIDKQSLQKITGNEIRVGNVLFLKNRCFQVLKTSHTMAGKGGAIVQAEMKDLQSGTKLKESFGSSKDVFKVFLEEINSTYLYDTAEHVIVLREDNFEEVEVDISLFGESKIFLKEEMEIKLLYAGATLLLVKLPKHIKVKVDIADPYAKNQTATSSYKNATLDCGLNIMVPQFIIAGEEIIINTEDYSYVSRANKT